MYNHRRHQFDLYQLNMFERHTMATKPIVVVDPHFRRMEEIFAASDLARLHALVEVVWGRDEPMPLDEARDALTSADAIVCTDWRYGDVLDQARVLRAILGVSGAFPRNLDYDQCFERRIRVLSAAPAFARQVAEMALGMALASSREIVAGDRAMRAGSEQWLWAGNQGTFMLYGKRVGLIGYGNLARALLPLLAPFGCPVSVYDPWLSAGYLRSQDVEPMSIEQLLATSQVIFVLATPSSENQALLSRALLEQIQIGAVLVLISRAHVVDFDALTDLVLAGRFKAAIDVFPNEPLAHDHPIRQAPGAVLSAHRAGSVREGLWEIGRMVVDDLEAITSGLPPLRLQIAQPELIGRYASNRVPPGSR
jgi:phosphoglycerate dehydrogenase-like enzyme